MEFVAIAVAIIVVGAILWFWLAHRRRTGMEPPAEQPIGSGPPTNPEPDLPVEPTAAPPGSRPYRRRHGAP